MSDFGASDFSVKNCLISPTIRLKKYRVIQYSVRTDVRLVSFENDQLRFSICASDILWNQSYAHWLIFSLVLSGFKSAIWLSQVSKQTVTLPKYYITPFKFLSHVHPCPFFWSLKRWTTYPRHWFQYPVLHTHTHTQTTLQKAFTGAMPLRFGMNFLITCSNSFLYVTIS